MLRTFWRLSGCAAKPYREATGNPVEEGTERLRSSTERCDVLRTMRDVWESVAAHFPDHAGTDPETTLNNRTVLASTGKRPVEIERPFCPHGHGNMMMQATPQQSLYWECSTCSTTSGLSLDGCDV